jgi:hypothetical protein
VVKPPRTETALDDLETPAPAENEVVKRDADVLIKHLKVTFGSVVVAELFSIIVSTFLVGENKGGERRTTCIGLTNVTPLVLLGTIQMLCCLYLLELSGSDLPMTR